MAIPTADDLIALLDSFPWADLDEALSASLLSAYQDIMRAQGARGAAAAGGAWNPQDPFLDRWATKYVGARVVQLQGTTREAVADLLRTVFDEHAGGGSLLELAEAVRDRVREQFAGYEDWRALRIARSESAIAYNHGDIFGYHQAGVSEVDVIDGTQDDICQAANGKRWPLAQALADPIGHPNCSRALLPVVPAAGAPSGEGQARAEISDDWAVICAQMAELIAAGEDPTPWLRTEEADADV